MWDTVQTQLEAALASTYFPKLIVDQDYKHLFAGLFTGARPTPLDRLDFAKLTPEQHTRLAEQIKVSITLFIQGLESKRAVKDSTVKFSLLKEVRIYRVAGASTARTLSGMWWFSEDVWKACVRAAGPRDYNRIKWLRHNLAIAYDWNSCRQIVKLDTGGDPGIPAIQAVGLPQFRFDSPGMFGQPLPGINHHARLVNAFAGGTLQTILPFIPKHDIHTEQVVLDERVRNPFE